MENRTMVVLGFLLAIGATVASPAQAGCAKDVSELLKFIVSNSKTNFSAINDGRENGSRQFKLTPAAEQFCPNIFILEDIPATDKLHEYWFVKFDYSHSGTVDETLKWLVQTFSSVLKGEDYVALPYMNDSGTIIWDGPSNTWVNVDIRTADDDKFRPIPGEHLLVIKVGHTIIQ